jgi:16S rRNA (guanine1207-N2)-methyltransferase
MRAMTTENLPLELYEKHAAALGLDNPVIFDSEKALFAERATPAPSALVFLPKSKALIAMTLAFASKAVVEGGTIVLAGAKHAGIESAKKLYEANVGPVEQKIVGNHSALYIGKNAQFGAGKTLENFLSYSPLIYKDVPIEVAQLPGVFSAGALDAGTKLLLDNMPFHKKRVLDMGCGAGVIGTIYKKLSPQSEVIMADASMLAVEASKRTAAKNDTEVQVLLSDLFSAIKGSFDLVLCNPPFHTGVDTDYSFIERFAKDVRARLTRHGEVYTVANSFLSYESKLSKGIGATEILVDDGKFRVYKSTLAAVEVAPSEYGEDDFSGGR